MPTVLERETAAPGGTFPVGRREPANHPGKVAADQWRPDDGLRAEVRAPRQDQPARLPRARVLGPRVG